MLTKLNRATLAEQAASQLLEFIQAQQLQPGSILPAEARLAAEFGVSRPVIREALRSLAGRGIVEIVNGKGAIVRPVGSTLLAAYFQRSLDLKRAAIIELMEVRRGLEVQTALLAARRRTPAQLHVIEEAVTAMRRHLDDPDAYIELDLTLHLLIAAATHNTMLSHLVESIRDSAKDAIRRGFHLLETGAEREHIQAQHEALLAALRAGDAEAAAQTMAAHIDDAIGRLIVGPDDIPDKVTG